MYFIPSFPFWCLLIRPPSLTIGTWNPHHICRHEDNSTEVHLPQELQVPVACVCSNDRWMLSVGLQHGHADFQDLRMLGRVSPLPSRVYHCCSSSAPHLVKVAGQRQQPWLQILPYEDARDVHAGYSYELRRVHDTDVCAIRVVQDGPAGGQDVVQAACHSMRKINLMI